MNRKTKSFIGRIFFIFVFSYLLNFLWEALHAYTLYESHDIIASKYVPMLLYVSLVDAFFISLIFAGGSLIFKREIKANNGKEILFILISGFIIAAIIELKALFLRQWSYSEFMPTLFGMGLSPLVQLSITGLIVIFITSKKLNK